MLENHFLGLSHPRAWRVLFHLPDQAFFISQRSKSDPWDCDAFPELRPIRSRAGVDHEEKSDLGTQRRAVHFSQVDKALEPCGLRSARVTVASSYTQFKPEWKFLSFWSISKNRKESGGGGGGEDRGLHGHISNPESAYPAVLGHH